MTFFVGMATETIGAWLSSLVSIISPEVLFWNSSATVMVSLPASLRMSPVLTDFGSALLPVVRLSSTVQAVVKSSVQLAATS